MVRASVREPNAVHGRGKIHGLRNANVCAFCPGWTHCLRHALITVWVAKAVLNMALSMLSGPTERGGGGGGHPSPVILSVKHQAH